MEPIYKRGQKVTIRSVKNQHYQLKYPELEQYVRQAGTVVESYLIKTKEPNSAGVEALQLTDNYLYRVHLYLQDKLVTVPEEALEPSESEDWDS